MSERGRIAQRLHRLYRQNVSRDQFGRRKATAREIEAVVHKDFTKLVDLHLPTTHDIIIKKEGEK